MSCANCSEQFFLKKIKKKSTTVWIKSYFFTVTKYSSVLVFCYFICTVEFTPVTEPDTCASLPSKSDNDNTDLTQELSDLFRNKVIVKLEIITKHKAVNRDSMAQLVSTDLNFLNYLFAERANFSRALNRHISCTLKPAHANATRMVY